MNGERRDNGSNGRRSEDDLREGLRQRFDAAAEAFAAVRERYLPIAVLAAFTFSAGMAFTGAAVALLAWRTLPSDVRELQAMVAENQGQALDLLGAQDSAHTTRISALERASITAEVTRRYLLCLHEGRSNCAAILFDIAVANEAASK